MTDEQDLRRPADPLARALHAARDAVGQAPDVARIKQRIDSALAGGAGSAGASSTLHAESAQTAHAGWLSAKWGSWTLFTAVGAAVITGVWWHAAQTSREPAPPRAAAVEAPSVTPGQAENTAPAEMAQASGAAARVRRDESQLRAARAPADAASVARARQKQPGTNTAPLHMPNVRPELPSADEQQVSEAPRGAANARTARGAQPREPNSDPEAEVALVSRAQQLIVSQPSAALARLAEHQIRFPHGVLAQERDTLRIDAERALGQSARAREHARAFIATYPDSPQARGLERWLAAQQSVASDHKSTPAPVLNP